MSQDHVATKAYIERLVIYWAKRNAVPPELALAVAYQESRFASLYPPRGNSGEIGVMQILPARCEAEGYPAWRLFDPEFNVALGTALLAQYYRETQSYARSAAMYVAGPATFRRAYSTEIRDYINRYSAEVSYDAQFFAKYV